MDVIDSDWIKSRLTGRRGEQVELARAMGLSADRLSKILRKERKVQASEIPAVLAFFGYGSPVSATHDDLIAAILGLPENLRREALQYVDFLKSREEKP